MLRPYLRMFSVCLGLLVTSEVANAQGAFDFLDPCIAAGNEVRSNAQAARSGVAAVYAHYDTPSPPPELQDDFVAAFREGVFQQWSTQPQIAERIAAHPEIDVRANFDLLIYPTIISPDREIELVNALYRASYEGVMKPKIDDASAQVEARISAQRGQYDAACSPDFVNQLFRVVIGGPFTIMSNNWNAAGEEANVVTGMVRFWTGISIEDIREFGILGGPNSEIRRLFDMGENNFIVQVFDAINPVNWAGEVLDVGGDLLQGALGVVNDINENIVAPILQAPLDFVDRAGRCFGLC